MKFNKRNLNKMTERTKTITIDFSLYQEELKTAYDAGKNEVMASILKLAGFAPDSTISVEPGDENTAVIRKLEPAPEPEPEPKPKRKPKTTRKTTRRTRK